MADEEERRRDDERGHVGPDVRNGTVPELRANGRERTGPFGRLDEARRRIEALERRPIALHRGEVHLFDHSREARRRLPPVVPRGHLPRHAVVARRGPDLEEQVRAIELAIEVFGEAGRAGLQRRAHAVALGVADLPEPAVLQPGEQHDEAEQPSGQHEHRRPESP
jgi:hypothetical protein